LESEDLPAGCAAVISRGRNVDQVPRCPTRRRPRPPLVRAVSRLMPVRRSVTVEREVDFQAIAQLKARYPNTPVAVTEPVADYLLQTAGTNNMTPWGSRPAS